MKLISLDTAIGKTIKEIADDLGERIGIRFEDDTFAVLAVRSNHESFEIQSESHVEEFDNLLVALGLKTEDESNAAYEEHRRHLAKRREAAERAEYEQLKKKFETS